VIQRFVGEVPAVSVCRYRVKAMPKELTGEFITLVSGELTEKNAARS